MIDGDQHEAREDISYSFFKPFGSGLEGKQTALRTLRYSAQVWTRPRLALSDSCARHSQGVPSHQHFSTGEGWAARLAPQSTATSQNTESAWIPPEKKLMPIARITCFTLGHSLLQSLKNMLECQRAARTLTQSNKPVTHLPPMSPPPNYRCWASIYIQHTTGIASNIKKYLIRYWRNKY